MWWLWAVVGVAAWLVVGFAAAVVVGRGIRLADRRSVRSGESLPMTTEDLPQRFRAAAEINRRVRARRRAIPLPPIGIALAAMAFALETTGYVLRLRGSSDTWGRLLSMDAPFSLPRMFVAALFAAAALTAVAGAAALPGRRGWWLAAGLVAGGIALVKAGSTVHRDAWVAMGDAVGKGVAGLLSVLTAVAVLGALWFLSRTERRDRRRILGVLAGYALASVGLSAVSSFIEDALGFGHPVAAAATYVEESGEALSGVAFLIAVLAGVAPRLVLPATWPLRRSADAHTLESPEQLPGRPAAGGSPAGSPPSVL